MADSNQWISVAKAALNDFRLDFGKCKITETKRNTSTVYTLLAIRVYRHLGDISMVWSLEEIQDVEDLQLLSAHIYVIFGDLEKAQVGDMT